VQIILDPEFNNSLKDIVSYITNDSRNKANSFQRTLLEKIKNLVHFPYKCRASIHYDDLQIRDLIFKGYTIPYIIDEDKQVIVILDIFKWMNK